MDSRRDPTHRLVDYDDSSSEEERDEEGNEEYIEIVEDYVRHEPVFQSTFLRLELWFKDVDPEKMTLEQVEEVLEKGFEKVIERVKSLSKGAAEYAKVELESAAFPGQRIPIP